MRSIESLAAFLAQTDYSYMGTQTVAELVDLFYPYFCDKIVDGKQLDQERLGHYLDCLLTKGLHEFLGFHKAGSDPVHRIGDCIGLL